MSTQLIPVAASVIGNQTVQTVDGRTLHTFLEAKTRFNDWIVSRIEEYGFEADKDFRSFLTERGFTENSVKPQGGRPTKEYALTLDMAKELAMVERTAKGKEARQYFIECEKRLHAPAAPTDLPPTTDAAALAQQLAELLKGKVLVDYAALQGMATALHAVAKTALCVLEEQCGKPLIQDLIPLKPHAPTAPPSRRSAARSVAEDPWQAPIAAFLNGRDEVTLVEISEFCLKEPRTHSSAVRVSGLLRSLGYACEVRRQGSRVLRVYRRVAHG